jgi:BirA family biotin operon repressor/biotin-[acetyl-CoA-carboxylase] ligase
LRDGNNYRLQLMPTDSSRAPLNVDALRDGVLVPESPWRRLDVVTTTGSTNGDLAARALAGEDIDGAVLIAETQTAGRGRNGREWSAAPGAQILVSVGVAADAVPTHAWGWLPLAAGVAVADAVSVVTGVEATLKWPNDVLAGGGKLAGILSEAVTTKTRIVVGIGLNVTLRSAEVPGVEIASLLELGVEEPDRDRLLRQLLLELGTRVIDWQRAGSASPTLIADYRARSATIGSRVRASLPGGGQLVGQAQDIDQQGRLLIDVGGDTVELSAGDVVHLRPTDEFPQL